MWQYVIVMSGASFRVNPLSIVCLNIKELLAQSWHYIWTSSHSNEIRTHNQFVKEHSTFSQTGQMIEVCCEYLSVRCVWRYVITMSQTSFRVNPHPIVCLNVKELHAWSMCHIWSSLTFRQTIECGFILKLVCDLTITYSQMHRIDKYSQHSSIIWPTEWLWAQISLLSFKLQIWCLLQARS